MPLSELQSASGVILIGSSVRAAAQSARRCGLWVIGADQFGDVDCREACDRYLDRATFHSHADWPTFNSRYPRLIVGGQHEFDGHANNPQAERLRCPEFLKEIAESAGLSFPETIRLLSPESASHGDGCLGSTNKGLLCFDAQRWLVKQRIRTGGLAVRWANRFRPNDLPTVSAAYDLQRWIAGRRYGASFISDGQDAVLLGVCRSLHTRKGEFPFVYGGSFGPVVVAKRLRTELQQLAFALVNALRLKGLFGADIIVDADQQTWLLEINDRWTASSELIERDLIERGVLDTAQSLIGSALLAHYPQLYECKGAIDCVQSASVVEIKRRLDSKRGLTLAGKAKASPPLLKKIVFAKQSGYFDATAAIHRLPAWIRLADVPNHDAKIAVRMPVVSLIATPPTRNRCDAWKSIRQAIAVVQRCITPEKRS